jgi:hypothetical protein
MKNIGINDIGRGLNGIWLAHATLGRINSNAIVQHIFAFSFFNWMPFSFFVAQLLVDQIRSATHLRIGFPKKQFGSLPNHLINQQFKGGHHPICLVGQFFGQHPPTLSVSQ